MAELNLPRWLAPALVIVLIAGVVVASRFLQPEEAPALRIACTDLRAGCRADLAGQPVELGVAGELKVLTPFEVWLKAPGAGTAQASFTMEGMDMGFNLYTLKPDATGTLRARVTLPVCVTGRRDWIMTLKVDGHALSVPFVTQL
ncbi:hypothetical protein EZJ19_09095 [Parasulfuritortus cantonensis]|uniref:Uncharacterized protein n=1 Tax=Parasulfuritortus cantonensis TaxID=2528202 RepID=A0A4R1BCP6_9PROT|nr:hypothetical protein [Parasulfuritortus cantonensis]TCJ14728.1 hypothetical protein EZJ19_09095 [Parasulfuritortus cantonensis]